MTYKTNWLRGILGPMLVSCTFAAHAVPANISANALHTAFIDNGAVFSMGYNKYGEVAPATSFEHRTPYFTGVLNAKSVAVNWHRTAVLHTDGSISIKGVDWSTYQPTQHTINVVATDVALTRVDTYFISNGVLYRQTGTQPAVAVPGGTNVKHVAAGNDHVLVLFNDGTVGGFGGNAFGQTGIGFASGGTGVITISTVTKTNLTNIVEISAGDYVSAARSATGEIFVFGKNDRGYLGLGNTVHQPTPVKVPNVLGAKKVQVSQSTTSYLAADGSLMVAGWHNYIEGALYNYDMTFVKMPIGVVKDYSAGGDYIMVNRGTVGRLEGWGGNGNGKLGDNSNLEKHQISTAYFTPVAPPPTIVVSPTPTPTPEVVAKPVDPTCNFSPFQKVSMTDILRCQIPIYTSMNACVQDLTKNYKIPGAGQVCKNLIIPSDRGQQEKRGGRG